MSHLLRCFLGRPNAFFSTSSLAAPSLDSRRVELICVLVAANRWPLLRKTLPGLHPSIVSCVLARFRSTPWRALRFFLWFGHESGSRHDVEGYGSILCILAESGLRACLWGLVQRMLFDRGKPFSIFVVDFIARRCVKPVVLDVVIVCLVKKRMFDDVVLVVNAIHRSGYVLPFKICNRLVRIFKINKEVSDPDLIIFSVFRTCLCNAGKNLNDGRAFYDYKRSLCLDNSDDDSACHNTQVLGSDDRKFVSESLQNTPKPNEFRHYIDMIRVLCLEGKVGVALYLKQEMREMGLIPDIVTHNYLMNGLCKCGDLPKANRLLREILEEGIVPNTCTYNTLIHGYCQYDSIDNAILIFLSMVKSGLRPDKVTCNILVHTLCNKGLLEGGKKILAEILDEKATLELITLTTLINGCFKVGDMNQASEIWDEMKRKGIVVDVTAYNVLVNGFSSSSNIGLAFGVLGEMFKKGFSPDVITYNSLITGLCREGKLMDACNIHNCMSIIGIAPDHISYKLVIHGLCLQGDVNVAQVFFHKMLNDFIVPNPPVWNLLIYGYGRAGEVGHAIRVRNWMHEFGHRPNVFTYNALIYTHLKEGNLQEAFLLKQEMLYDEMLRRGCEPDIYTYTELIRGLCLHGEVEEAEELLMRIQKSGLTIDHVPFHILIKKYCQTKAPRKAYDLYEQMKGKGIMSRFSTYYTLMTELKKKGFMQEACEVLNNIKLRSVLQSDTFV